MIDPELSTLSTKLIFRFEKLEKRSPYYGLDASWFALNLLDYQFKVLYRLGYRSVEEMGDQSRELIKEIASFLGVIGARCWEEFGGHISLENDERYGVLLRARGGDSLPDTGAHEARIENNLLNLLLNAPKQIEICLLYTSPSPRDRTRSRMPSSA